MEQDLDAVEKNQKRAAAVATFVCFLLHHLYLPISVAFGWASVHWGPLAELSLRGLLPGFLACFLVVHFAIVSPFLFSGTLEPGKPGRWLLVAFLWAAPLFSFAYWVGDFKQSLHAVDFSYSLLASLGFALILYRRTRSSFALSLGVTAGVFFPLFVLDDILGPFRPVWVYSTLEPSVYLLRAVSTSFAVLAACFYPLPAMGRRPSSLPERRFFLVLFAFLGSLLCLFECSSFSTPGLLAPDLNWVACLALIFFLRRRDPFGRKWYVRLSLLFSVSLLVQWLILVAASEGTTLDQVKLLYVSFIQGVVVTELAVRFGAKTWVPRYFSKGNLSEA